MFYFRQGNSRALCSCGTDPDLRFLSANRFATQRFLTKPNCEPDKAKRAKLVSSYLYSMEWWLKDAHYWRLRKGKTNEKANASNKNIRVLEK